MAQGTGTGHSLILAEELFGAQDGRFVTELREVAAAGALAGFTERWKKDPRPWARAQILEYLSHPLNRPGHQPVVKRLFKHAEAHNDDELMAAFMVAFDTLVRHSVLYEHVSAPRDSLPGVRKDTNPAAARVQAQAQVRRARKGGRLFSYHTRYYLRRRVWRYFRRLAFARPKEFVPAVSRALRAYRDDDLLKTQNIMDSWSLLHACYGEALHFTATSAALPPGRTLGELLPAPFMLKLWQQPEAMSSLLQLVQNAESRLVRLWSMQLLRREHKERLASLEIDAIAGLLDHADEEVQQFGAEILQTAAVDKLPITDWLRLLKTRNLTALDLVCQAFAKHVSPDRIDLAQCVEMACARQAPVARLGLNLLKQRTISTPEERAKVAAVADTRCASLAGELAQWALTVIARDSYDRDLVLRFFDSLQPAARGHAWTWLVGQAVQPAIVVVQPKQAGQPAPQAYNDAELWARLLETPFDDLRLSIINHLERRATTPVAKGPGFSADALAPLWCSVLLAIHRGGRQKIKAVRQLGEAIRQDPAKAEALLPILSIALRSVRGPEARAGLAALVGAVEANPQLTPLVQSKVPELLIEAEVQA
ncbi:MAG TPA: hypothetical protein VGP72_33845 [Planctomycetota bacterium]|jgi:hypothetical protein